MFYYIESVGSELCGAMLPQSSVLSCPISRLVPAELAPGRKKMARRNDGAISGVPPVQLPLRMMAVEVDQWLMLLLDLASNRTNS